MSIRECNFLILLPSCFVLPKKAKLEQEKFFKLFHTDFLGIRMKKMREKQNDLSHVRQSVESIDIEVKILEAIKIFFLLQTCGLHFSYFPS